MPLVNAYCTVEQVRTHLGDEGGVADASVLERAISSASRGIDAFCGRRFWRDDMPTVRRYRTTEKDIAWVADIADTAGLVVATDPLDDGTFAAAWDGTDFELEPSDADLAGPAYAWWRIVAVGGLRFPTLGKRRGLRVTATHGWSQIPDDIEEAAILRAAGLYKRRDSPQGVAGFDGFGAVRVTRQDPDVVALLRPFMRVVIRAV